MVDKLVGEIWSVIRKMIIGVISFFLKLFGKELTDVQKENILQFFKFAIVGVSNTLISTLINFSILFACNRLNILQQKDGKIYLANCTAFFLSVLWSYYWNNRYVFKENSDGKKRVWWKTLLKTYMAYAFTGLGLSNLFSYLFVTVLNLNEYIAVLINLVIAVPINYLLNKFWAYGQKKAK